MMPRLFDERVGYFSRRTDRLRRRTSIARRRAATSRAGGWRRKIRPPQLSEPVKPIVYYVDPATPTKWVPYIKRGIENWQPAFEEAGFKNAILAKEAPTPARGPRLEPGGRALLGDSLAALDHRERVGPARARSAHGRDSRERTSSSTTTS